MKKNLIIKTIDALPENFQAFRDSLSLKIGTLYGTDAAMSIKSSFKRVMNAQIHQENVLSWSARYKAGKTVGLLIMVLQGDRAKITMLDILPEYRNEPIEIYLLEEAIKSVQHAGIATILFDTALDDAYKLDQILGFKKFPRIMMRIPALELAQKKQDETVLTQPLDAEHLPYAATCIVDAYHNHPDGLIYREVRDKIEACNMLKMAMTGRFGDTDPQWMRMIWNEKHCKGGIVATRLFPETVFILQVFVDAAYHRQGFGRILLVELAKAVEKKAPGDTIVLCVSADNPARHLYANLGFSPFYTPSVYLWEK